MNPIQHPSNNSVLEPPAGMTPEQCAPLPITRVMYADQVPAVVSFWQPSAEQLALLNAGKPLWLSVVGRTHPPLMLGVEGDGRLA